MDKRLGFSLESFQQFNKKKIGQATFFIGNENNDVAYLIQSFERQPIVKTLA
jgi:hypothetical protein